MDFVHISLIISIRANFRTPLREGNAAPWQQTFPLHLDGDDPYKCTTCSTRVQQRERERVVIDCIIIQGGEACWNCAVVGIVITVIISNTTTAAVVVATPVQFYFIMSSTGQSYSATDLGTPVIKTKTNWQSRTQENPRSLEKTPCCCQQI